MSCTIIESDTQNSVRVISWQTAARPESIESTQLHSRLQDLTQSVESRIRESSDRAFQEGYLAAKKALEHETRGALERLAGSLDTVATARKEAIERAEMDILHLSVEIARRVIHREVTVDQSALSGLISAAVEKLKQQEIIRVRLHPAHEAVVRACLQKTGRYPDLEIVADPGQSPGTVLFETSRGSLDASVGRQLKEIEMGLVDELRNRE